MAQPDLSPKKNNPGLKPIYFLAYGALVVCLFAVLRGIVQNKREDVPISQQVPAEPMPQPIAIKTDPKADDIPQAPTMLISNGEEPMPAASVAGSDSLSIIGQARKFAESGNATQAIELLRQALEHNPGDKDLWLELGMIYLLDKNDPQEASRNLEKVVEIDPSNRQALNELAFMYSQEEFSTRGKEFFEQEIQRHPENAELSHAYSQYLTNRGQTSEAITHLEKIQQNQSSQPELKEQASRELAEAYVKNGDYRSAIETYQKTISSMEQALAALPPKNPGEEPGDHGASDFKREQLENFKQDYIRTLLKDRRIEEATRALESYESSTQDKESVTYLRQEVERARNR